MEEQVATEKEDRGVDSGQVSLKHLQAEAWRTAEEHGWHDEPRTVGDRLALMHSEISEALEEFRAGHAPSDTYTNDSPKPEGVAVELADCVIRILDFCEEEGIELEEVLREKMAYNETRPFRHGGKVI